MNLAAAEGHPSEVMDLSFADQALCSEFIDRKHKGLENGVHEVPKSIDDEVAKLKLESVGVEIDVLTKEQEEYLMLAGVDEGGLQQLIRKSYQMLNLISFFSMNKNEVRAWTIRDGWKAPQAAGVIHTDFERGFIRAEVLSFESFVKFGGLAAARAAGALRIEGKEYKVIDGDVIYFRFNV